MLCLLLFGFLASVLADIDSVEQLIDTDNIYSRLSPCAQDIVKVFNGEYPDAYKIVDSCGKNVNHLGNFDECQALSSARYTPFTLPSHRYVSYVSSIHSSNVFLFD